MTKFLLDSKVTRFLLTKFLLDSKVTKFLLDSKVTKFLLDSKVTIFCSVSTDCLLNAPIIVFNCKDKPSNMCQQYRHCGRGKSFSFCDNADSAST